MNIARDREKGTITINQRDYIEDVVECFGMKDCNPVYMPGVGPDASQNQPEETLLDEEGKKRYQSITGAPMYLGEVIRYDTLLPSTSWRGKYQNFKNPYESGQAPPSVLGRVHKLLNYLQAGRTQAYAESNAKRRHNPDSDKSTSSYIVMLANGPISFKMAFQSLTAQSTMERELVATALNMKEVVFCSNMLVELGFEKGFRSVPLNLDNISTLRVAGNLTYSPRAKHIVLRYFSFNS